MLIDCTNEARLNYSVVRNKTQNLIGHNKILLLTLNCSHWRKGSGSGSAFLCSGFCRHSKKPLPPQHKASKFLEGKERT